MDSEPDDDTASETPTLVWQPLKPPDSNLYTWLRTADRRFARNLGRFLKEGGIIASEWSALRALYRPQNFSALELTAALGMSKGGGSKLLKRLVRKGLAVKQQSKYDRRYRSVCLTPQARKLVVFLAQLETAADREFYRSLGGTRRYRLAQWMKTLLESSRGQHMDRWIATKLDQSSYPAIDPDVNTKAAAKAQADYDKMTEYLQQVQYAAATGGKFPPYPDFD